MLGEYGVFVRSYAASTPWKMTATVNGVVEWIEEGILADADTDEGSSSRRLSTCSDTSDTTTYNAYSVSDYYPESDTFTVTLDSYDPAGC